MKLLVALGVIVGGYLYLLLHTTDIVMSQTQQLQNRYQSMAAYAEHLSDGE